MSRPRFVTKDSGERREFSTGSRRDSDEGKGRPSLIPTIVMQRLAALYQRGEQKYGSHNWRKGQPISSYVDSLYRHLWNIQNKVDDGEDHEAAVVWNATAILWTLEAIRNGSLPEELDDRIWPTEAPTAFTSEKATVDAIVDDKFF